ncbi:glutamine synthetase family protein [Streptomyces sp. NBC_00243]|uniref:glutamine synthetase family protein n=1 Tax=Streptomyces sp. NBC_00243 TaxID=2975688 RepID=UPI002DDB766D|nr:glutamine synthetase family protein [Streptomyces sp. NBC_00243]WRZ17362.1 glutamine synthetase family protein [Streptomyces sp. NBC_00243]
MFSRTWSNCYPVSSVGRPSFVTEFGVWDERQTAAAEQIEAGLGDIDLIRVVFCDPHGLARSKTLSSDVFRTVLRNGMDFSPGPFLFDTGHAVALNFLEEDAELGVGEILGAGDFVLVPDPSTFQVLPGIEPRTALVLGDEFLRDGSPHPLGTRSVLRRVCAQYASRELAPVVGLEVEWYLTRLLGDAPGHAGNGFGRQGSAPSVQAMNSGYQFNLDAYSDSVSAVTGPLCALLLDLGLPLRTMEHESGPGQLETTFSPMLALEAADGMLLFRTLTKQFCARRGFHASFMALPGLESFDPSGWHVHQSVMNTKTGENLFAATDSPDGMSSHGKGYADSLLAHARDLCMLSVPTINGYRRLSPDFALSPTRIDQSFENRTAMLRILGSHGTTHVENRIAEPCANPYLAIAAQLFAGLDGITGDFVRAQEDSSSQSLPRTLHESLAEFRGSRAARDLLGAPLASCLSKLKESEIARYAEWSGGEHTLPGEVTDWEQREYFEVY